MLVGVLLAFAGVLHLQIEALKLVGEELQQGHSSCRTPKTL